MVTACENHAIMGIGRYIAMTEGTRSVVRSEKSRDTFGILGKSIFCRRDTTSMDTFTWPEMVMSIAGTAKVLLGRRSRPIRPVEWRSSAPSTLRHMVERAVAVRVLVSRGGSARPHAHTHTHTHQGRSESAEDRNSRA